MQTIETGTLFSQDFHPTAEHFASAVGNEGVDVISTTALILFFETASDLLIKPFFEHGEVSVGTRVNIEHCAPAHAGKVIQVNAEFLHRKGRRLTFKVKVTQNNKIVMTGTHERAVVKRNKFEHPNKTNIQANKRRIDFWFDFHSPWCYFASHQIGELARKNNCELIWRPVHLANLSTAVDGRRPLEANTPFVNWYTQDQYDTAQLLNLPFCPHEKYPLRPSRALRIALYADECNLAEAFIKAVMRGYWAEQKDISDLGWLMQVGSTIGLNASSVEKAASSEEYKKSLSNNLNNAVANKMFGLPTSIINDKIFWGNDRLNYLQYYLDETLK